MAYLMVKSLKILLGVTKRSSWSNIWHKIHIKF